MSLSTTNLEIDIINNIFKSHPMWNYRFYIIIEPKNNIGTKPIGIGFKDINLLSDLIDGEANYKKLMCKNGLSHDGEIHRFIDESKKHKSNKFDILILQIEEEPKEYDERLKNSVRALTSVKNAWIVKNAILQNWETNGFDAMSNEIFVHEIIFDIDCIEKAIISEEAAKEKAKLAISKLF